MAYWKFELFSVVESLVVNKLKRTDSIRFAFLNDSDADKESYWNEKILIYKLLWSLMQTSGTNRWKFEDAQWTDPLSCHNIATQSYMILLFVHLEI